MTHSMTGFASARGAGLGHSWTWDMRSVNAKGLDIRLRLPDWIDGLEAPLRTALTGALSRGSVNVTLRVAAESHATSLTHNPVQLTSVLDAMTRIETEAMERGLSLAPANAADILSLRGVLDTPQASTDVSALRAALIADFTPVLDNLVTMRATEGAALHNILTAQLSRIDTLIQQAAQAAADRADVTAANLRTNLARVMDNVDADPQRIAQELALIAVKADVTEEIDRLRAHVNAACSLLDSDEPIGRKLDFLMQEFNREANTLCAKAGSAPLTAIGLDLKTVIDQMREQVQNVA